MILSFLKLVLFASMLCASCAGIAYSLMTIVELWALGASVGSLMGIGIFGGITIALLGVTALFAASTYNALAEFLFDCMEGYAELQEKRAIDKLQRG